MTYEENVRAILECNFTGFKEEIIDTATQRICELTMPKVITIPTELIEKVVSSTIKVYNERSNGEWILNALVTEGQCSICEARARLVFGVNYCPNCGAKMKIRKETENE